MPSICFAVDEDAPLIRFQETEDQPKDRRLPRAAGAQEDLRVPRLQREANVAQDHLVVEREPHLVEDDDRPAGPEGLLEERRAGPVLDSHQYIKTMMTLVTRKSTAMTATELATTAFVVARPTPCVPPVVRMPT